MRRNTTRLLKYLIAAVLLLMFGPFAMKQLFGNEPSARAPRGNPNAFLPNDPDIKIKDIPEVPDVNDGKPRAIDVGVSDELKKIDWHNYAQIAAEQQRTGPGEQGAAVILTAEEEKQKDALYKVNGFNAFCSDKIALDRAIKDIRHPECKSQKYWNKLPNASVVIPFHNEHWTTLLRLVVSIQNRSPPGMIHEVILADDFSNKEHCGKPLDDYVNEHWSNVKVVRAKKREGLIRTRLMGAKVATGDVLIFLDSHCEVGINWLPPLLDPIQDDYRTVVCPFIDVIDFETFAYRAQDEGARGAFDWEFFYKRLPLLPDDLKHPARPFKSPVMAGGLFAMHQRWFWELGGYDPGLDIWGGEQYELSFKLWQCGGTMVDAPCSRIGHVYRKFAPFPNPGIGDFIGRNYKRVAEVWMDEYKEYLYKRRPHYRNIDTGDISDQLAIRQKLNCKPFKWFMEEVAFDLPKHYPPVEPPPYAEGEVKNLGANMCIDTRFRGQPERFGIEPCISDGPGHGGEQNLELSWHKDMRPKKRNVCFDVSTSTVKSPVILYSCHGMKGNQFFKYNINTKQLFHPVSRQCLDADAGSKEVFMNPCDDNSKTQQWTFQTINTAEVRQLWKEPINS
ncbi:unnamed protein product [Owenia fusiformis]|uniref:Polypeptide N-acetylgalactosaminyltransferase n=1 Tax=Owenia fusiformis TaxID=6347 RepID=A0A8J1TGQ5_OWEFU|nr:unnamed protein product [Owenia fusiformis]